MVSIRKKKKKNNCDDTLLGRITKVFCARDSSSTSGTPTLRSCTEEMSPPMLAFENQWGYV